MKKVLILFILLFSSQVFGQTVYTKQDVRLTQCDPGGGACVNNVTVSIPGGVYTGVFSVANPQWTRWAQVDDKRTIIWDITFVDANASITSVDMQCFTAQVETGAVGTGFRLPVYVATSAAGVTTSTPSTIRQVNNAGGAPGTSNWPWAVTNIPGAWIICSFTANGIVTAAVDTIAINARGIVP
jgi:hypothetical protein